MTSTEKKTLHILYVDDQSTDIEKVQKILKAEEVLGNMLHVETAEGLSSTLEKKSFDLILSGYSVSSFDEASPLEIVRRMDSHVPFIFISEPIGEQKAFKEFKKGASGFVLKENLTQLMPVVRAALADLDERLENERTEESLRVAHEEMEDRIKRRASELLKANEELKEELARRERLESELEKYRKHLGEVAEQHSPELQVNNPKIQKEIIERERIGALAAAVEQLDEIVIITDPEGVILYVNAAFEKVTGYSYEETIGQNPRILKSEKHEEGFYQEMWAELSQGKIWKGHLVNKRKDGTLYEEDMTIVPIYDKEGTLTNYVGIKRDVTYEVQLENKLRSSQKMEAIGTLAGGIAHDFNNILFAISSYATMGKKKTPADSRNKHYFEQIFNASSRAKDLIQQILTFSRQHEQQFQPVDITPLVKESMKLMRASLPTTIEINHKLEAQNTTLFADPTQIHQIIVNLCSNAGYAMRETGGKLLIELANSTLDIEAAFSHEIIEGEYLKLTVKDTGCGMTSYIKDRIFDPFFTTKPAGEGSGMGLAMVHGIVKSHHGAVAVKSEPGRGTTFEILLPLVVETSSPDEDYEITPAGKESILFIDDEELIIDSVQDILEDLGYIVTATTDSIEALKLFRSNPNRFDVVLTDQTMQNMTGIDLAEEILRIRPRMPIILATGFSETVSQDKAQKLGIRGYLTKPITEEQLNKAIQQALKT
ncbi:MAG: response regulator [SAR324 cluster bacterium]|nr:response regulator [SAR324 cluster bacterium]